MIYAGERSGRLGPTMEKIAHFTEEEFDDQIKTTTNLIEPTMVAVMGGIAGGVIVGAITEATDIRWGLASLAPTGIVGGLLMTRGASTIDDDIARVAEESAGDPLAAFL